jgi:two-component system sensor histidine kinase RegB
MPETKKGILESTGPMTPSESDSSRKILKHLYFLRLITISFLFLMAVLAVAVLNIHLPVWPLGLIMMLMVGSNLLIRYLLRLERWNSFYLIYSQLILEVLLFGGVLYYTGGATNPFTFLFLIPLAVAATVIPGLPTWSLTTLTVILYSLLLKFYVPLAYGEHAHHHMADGGQFTQHVLGMWFGFLVSAVLVTWFITYLSRELKQRDRDISEARQRELRDQQMVTLGTLAAGTAHELGTPLASLAVITGELTDGFDPERHAELFENQQILRQQIERCKKILSVLSDSAGESRAGEGHLMSVGQFIDHVTSHWSDQRPEMLWSRLDKAELKGRLLFDTTLSQAIINLLNNAADATRDQVEIEATTHDDFLELDILDRGEGMSDEQIAKAGDVSFSSKPDGMGIGLFLAITTVRRSGGDIAFSRRPGGGTITRIRLPLLESAHD